MDNLINSNGSAEELPVRFVRIMRPVCCERLMKVNGKGGAKGLIIYWRCKICGSTTKTVKTLIV